MVLHIPNCNLAATWKRFSELGKSGILDSEISKVPAPMNVSYGSRFGKSLCSVKFFSPKNFIDSLCLWRKIADIACKYNALNQLCKSHPHVIKLRCARQRGKATLFAN